MRIRCKPWARPELEASQFYVMNAEEMKGKWNNSFDVPQKPLFLELGCGKGGFISQAAIKYHDTANFVAIDIKNEMLVLAKRKIEQAYIDASMPIDNVKIMIKNIETIDNCFDSSDNVQRIYINFCNPWPKKKHKKRRLTHSRQLMKYRSILSENGKIYFKTDDDELFDESFEYFAECGYNILYKTYDLHNSDFTENLMTEHEKMFTDEGKKIKFLIASPDKNFQKSENFSTDIKEL